MNKKMTTIKRVAKVFVTLSMMTAMTVSNANGQNPSNSGDEFTQNRGQVLNTDGNLSPDVLFYSSGNGIGYYLA